MSEKRGTYVILEGGDGAGKDTQADLLTAHLQTTGRKVLRINEPDDTLPTGKLLRQMLKDGSYREAHAAMFLADRMAMLPTKVVPALEADKDVVSVRSFLSTLVYQQENWPLEWLLDIHKQLPAKADLLIILTLDAETALQRSRKRPGPDEVYEKLDIQRRVQERYVNLGTTCKNLLAPGAHVAIIDANGTPAEVHQRVLDAVAKKVLS